MKLCPACSRDYADDAPRCESCGVGLVSLVSTENSRTQDLLGEVVDNRYRVDRVLGRGGMGTVYACVHVVVGKELALKVLHPGSEPTSLVLDRFVREAQAAARIKSKHICEVLDFGQLPDGSLYAAMELLEGEDVARALRRGRLNTRQLIHVFTQAADTLALAHDCDIVHRDLKPDNLFLVQGEEDPLFLKILDFGIAKFGDRATNLTDTGVILGTPFYMSPEQARGEAVDARTDIYSLGVVMYRAFTGRLPFVADSTIGVLSRHVTDPPEPPSRIANVDPAVEAIILRCLEKKPAARFADMRQLAAALREALAHLGGSAALPVLPISTPSGAFAPPPSGPLRESISGPVSATSLALGPVAPPSAAPHEPATSRVMFASTTGPRALPPTAPPSRKGLVVGLLSLGVVAVLATAVALSRWSSAPAAAETPAAQLVSAQTNSPPVSAAPAAPPAPPEPSEEPPKAAAVDEPSAAPAASAAPPALPPSAATAKAAPKKKRPAEIRSPFD